MKLTANERACICNALLHYYIDSPDDSKKHCIEFNEIYYKILGTVEEWESNQALKPEKRRIKKIAETFNSLSELKIVHTPEIEKLIEKEAP